MTSRLSTIANGKVVLCLEGGYELKSLSDCATACLETLLGKPLPLLPTKGRERAQGARMPSKQ
eukprot:Pgem_evm1s2645